MKPSLRAFLLLCLVSTCTLSAAKKSSIGKFSCPSQPAPGEDAELCRSVVSTWRVAKRNMRLKRYYKAAGIFFQAYHRMRDAILDLDGANAFSAKSDTIKQLFLRSTLLLAGSHEKCADMHSPFEDRKEFAIGNATTSANMYRHALNQRWIATSSSQVISKLRAEAEARLCGLQKRFGKLLDPLEQNAQACTPDGKRKQALIWPVGGSQIESMFVHKSPPQPRDLLADESSKRPDLWSVEQHFGTNIIVSRLKDPASFNERIKQAVDKVREQSPGRVISNRGGWQSEANLFQPNLLQGKDGSILQQLHLAARVAAYSIVSDMSISPSIDLWNYFDQINLNERTLHVDQVQIFQAWANYNGRDHYNARHSHGHYLAGVYVASDGATSCDGDPGMLEFIDPRVQARHSPQRGVFGFGESFFVKPKPGSFIFFPGWLKHRVTPHNCAGERLTIAFNVMVMLKRRSALPATSLHPRHGVSDILNRLSLSSLRLFSSPIMQVRLDKLPPPPIRSATGKILAACAVSGESGVCPASVAEVMRERATKLRRFSPRSGDWAIRLEQTETKMLDDVETILEKIVEYQTGTSNTEAIQSFGFSKLPAHGPPASPSATKKPAIKQEEVEAAVAQMLENQGIVLQDGAQVKLTPRRNLKGARLADVELSLHFLRHTDSQTPFWDPPEFVPKPTFHYSGFINVSPLGQESVQRVMCIDPKPQTEALLEGRQRIFLLEPGMTLIFPSWMLCQVPWKRSGTNAAMVLFNARFQ